MSTSICFQVCCKILKCLGTPVAHLGTPRDTFSKSFFITPFSVYSSSRQEPLPPSETSSPADSTRNLLLVLKERTGVAPVPSCIARLGHLSWTPYSRQLRLTDVRDSNVKVTTEIRLSPDPRDSTTPIHWTPPDPRSVVVTSSQWYLHLPKVLDRSRELLFPGTHPGSIYTERYPPQGRHPGVDKTKLRVLYLNKASTPENHPSRKMRGPSVTKSLRVG